jgi:hypothetical protein
MESEKTNEMTTVYIQVIDQKTKELSEIVFAGKLLEFNKVEVYLAGDTVCKFGDTFEGRVSGFPVRLSCVLSVETTSKNTGGLPLFWIIFETKPLPYKASDHYPKFAG